MPIRFRPFLLLALQRMDAEVLRDKEAFEACFESSRRAWRASVEGVIADAEIYAQPWGFSLEEIRVPVRLWHGTRDRTFSYHLAEELAATLAQLPVATGGRRRALFAADSAHAGDPCGSDCEGIHLSAPAKFLVRMNRGGRN